MPYVTGEKGIKIQELMDKSDIEFDNNNYEESIFLLEQAWDEIPDDKISYSESFLIVWGILDISILVKDVDRMNNWVDKIFFCSPQRGDTGERELWAGKVAYELGNFEKAKEYFKLANDKSKGRCFGTKDGKYIKFFKQS